MRRLGLVVSFSLVFAAAGCGSSGGGGTGGSGGATGTGGASATGGTTGSGGTDGGAGNGGAGGAPAACGSDNGGSGKQCSSVTATASGPCVVTMMSSAAAPTPAGGTIGNGTYQLTSSTFYGALPDGGENGDFQTRRETFVVKNATATSLTLDQIQAQGTQMSAEEGTVSISGTSVTYTPTCPAPGDGGDQGGTGGYTATSTTFTLLLSEGGGTLVRVYTKI